MSIRGSSVDVEAVNSASPLLPNDWGARGVRLGQSLRHDFRIVLFSNHSNVLLVFVPFAVLSDFLQWSSAVIFTMNFLALIPLALLLSFATKELTKRVGSTGGSLINVTFGNATELIVGIVALMNDQIHLIQTSMLGSILSTLLFVIHLPFLICTYELDTGNDFRSWRNKTFGIHFQWMGSANDEFVHVSGNGKFNPPHGI